MSDPREELKAFLREELRNPHMHRVWSTTECLIDAVYQAGAAAERRAIAAMFDGQPYDVWRWGDRIRARGDGGGE